MRIFGGLLIVLGLLFCLSIIGAVVGIPMILIGIVCLIVGGRRHKTVITNVVTVNSPEPRSPPENWSGRPLRDVPYFDPQAPPKLIDATPVRPTRDHTSSNVHQTANAKPYDEAKWEALVRYDTDIARVAAALKPYGEKYVDELAQAYLVLNDKQYLPMIIQKIVETAKKDAAASNVEAIRPVQREAGRRP
jgi:hypothetical protein